MPNKPHLYFRGDQIHTGGFRYRPRYIDNEDEAEPDRDFRPMQDVFLQSLNSFNRKRRIREENRIPELDVFHMDYIQLNFFDVFDISSFEVTYRDHFGLSPVSFSNFNRSGLFAIENRHQFENFIRDVQVFIEAEDPLDVEVEYSPAVRFIQSFDGFSTEEMLKIRESHPKVVLDIIKTPRLFNQFVVPVRDRLIEHLEELDISYQLNDQAETMELDEPTWEDLIEIANNFDIIQSISSHDSGIIRPSTFGTPIREFGFTINEEGIENLPIIGVLDSGISDQTPIAPLIVLAEPSFDLTNTDPYEDHIDHGTGVAALSALGRKPYPEFQGTFEADARILPIKIIHENHTPISQAGVINAIRRAYHELGVKIFTLSITWEDYKGTHEKPSEYTLALDRIAMELDILIFISTGNRDFLLYPNGEPLTYPFHFLDEESNLETPADSMNNITVGAIADDLSNQNFAGLSIGKGFPGIYSRKFHYDWDDEEIRNKKFINLKLVKPDILMPGGDFDQRGFDNVYGIKVLSSETGMFFKKSLGTSYSAPLAANLAAKLLRQYPEISMQSLKAILINAAREIRLGNEFKDFSARTITAICGYGVPKEAECIFSDDHRATFIIEGQVSPEEYEVLELKLPDYLQDVPRSRGLLKIHATLCFKFDPVPDNQMAYCPIHFAFGFFKNVAPEQITTERMGDVKLKQEGWTEDYYFKNKVFSNTQKIDFSISKRDLVSENNTVRIGIHSRLHKHLDAGRLGRYNRPHHYSLAISIEEKTKEEDRTHNLYDELIAINQLEAIGEIEIELDAEA